MNSLYVKFFSKKLVGLLIFIFAAIFTTLFLDEIKLLRWNLITSKQSSALKVQKNMALKDIRLCPAQPRGVVGNITINKFNIEWEWKVLEDNYTSMYDIKPGGRWKPKDCEARHRVSIVVPYRDRDSQLKVFIRHMHPFLRKQQIDYGIYIVEMPPDVKFNRAMLMNIGFIESLKIHDYQCFMFHDVDLIPENDRNIYSCPPQDSPRHMSAYIDSWKYTLRNKKSFGGVSSMTKEQMYRVNGYSNIYFGWGCEDDDMYRRVAGLGMKLSRYSEGVARYMMLRHKPEVHNPIRQKLLQGWKTRWKDDGLVANLKYKIIAIELHPLYTLIKVNINEAEVTSKYSEFIERVINETANHNLLVKNRKNKT